MPDPLVSIIIPVYNSEKYIADTIASALAQTWLNKEIIIIDDGSTDSSLSIAEGFDSSIIKIIKQEKKGASAARNNGLSMAKGEYIQFLDADDLLSPNKITEQMRQISGQQDCLSICQTIYFSDSSALPLMLGGRIEKYNDPAAFFLNMYYISTENKDHWGQVAVHSWLSPKKLIDKAGMWNENLTVDDDGEFFCRVMLASKQIIYTPDAICYYRKNITEPSLSTRKDLSAMKSILLSSELKYRHIKEKSNSPFINIAFARVFMENAVTFYPEYKDLSRQAEIWVKNLGGTDYIPALGGKGIEIIKKYFGWKFSKYLQFTFGKSI